MSQWMVGMTDAELEKIASNLELEILDPSGRVSNCRQ